MIDEQIPVSKPCRTCKEVKLLDLFPKRTGAKDGHLNECKECFNAKNRIVRLQYEEQHKVWAKNRRKQLKAEFDSGSRVPVASKYCTRCKKEKGSPLFYVDKFVVDGLSVWCIECTAKATKVFRDRQDRAWRDKENARLLEYAHNNKEIRKETCKKSYEKHKEEQAEYRKAYREAHKKEALETRRAYRATPEGREKLNTYNRENRRMRMLTDPEYRLLVRCRARVRSAIKKGWKSASTMELVGCSISVARAYIESQFYPNPETGEEMSWNNNSTKGWEIDHVIPLVSFDQKIPENQKKSFNVSNMQPMWVKEHKAKHRDWHYDAPPGVTLETLMAKYLKWKEEYDKSNKG
jgi:hypothetical protein